MFAIKYTKLLLIKKFVVASKQKTLFSGQTKHMTCNLDVLIIMCRFIQLE